MVWLNWSLKLYIRLRTISLLISTSHITRVCSMNVIFICVIVLDKMCFHMLNLCWSNTKRFFSVLVIFGKYFVFAKIVKIFKNSVALFWRLSRGLVQLQTHTMIFRSSLASQCPNHKKDLEYFSKFWVFNISRNSVWWLVCGWKV